MYKRLRTLLIIGIVAIAVAAFIRFRSNAEGNSSAGNAVQETSTVERGDIVRTISATASLHAHQEVSLAFPVTGKVAVINASEGDYVRKGQVIASLDNQTYQDALLLTQATVDARRIALRKLTDKPRQADIDVAQANLNIAKAQLASVTGADKLQVAIDQFNVEKAKNGLWTNQLQRDSDNQKKQDLLNNPITKSQANSLPSDAQHDKNINSSDYDVQIAQSQLANDQSKSGDIGSLASAQAKVLAAQIDLDTLVNGGNKNDIAQSQAQLDAASASLEQARKNLAKTILVAPFDGVISKLNLHLGETPQAGPAVIMLDNSSFYVELAVDERDISRVAVDQAATLTFDSMPGTVINGKVVYVAPTAAKNGDVVTYLVRIEFVPNGQTLLSSLSTTVSIITDQLTNVMRVRNRFIRLDRTADKGFVTVKQADGTFKEIPVTLGLRNDTYSEIKSGLAVGDTIVILQTPLAGRPGGAGAGQ